MVLDRKHLCGSSYRAAAASKIANSLVDEIGASGSEKDKKTDVCWCTIHRALRATYVCHIVYNEGCVYSKRVALGSVYNRSDNQRIR